MVEKAIGFIETDSVAAGIEAADAAVKRASVELLEARSICPGKYMVLFRGDTKPGEQCSASRCSDSWCIRRGYVVPAQCSSGNFLCSGSQF